MSDTDRDHGVTTTTVKQQLLGPASRGKYSHQCEATWMCGRVWASASKDVPLVGFFLLFFFFVSCMKSPIKSGNQKHFKICTFLLKNPCNSGVYCNIRRFGHNEHLFQMASSEHPADLRWAPSSLTLTTLPCSCRHLTLLTPDKVA